MYVLYGLEEREREKKNQRMNGSKKKRVGRKERTFHLVHSFRDILSYCISIVLSSHLNNGYNRTLSSTLSPFVTLIVLYVFSLSLFFCIIIFASFSCPPPSPLFLLFSWKMLQFFSLFSFSSQHIPMTRMMILSYAQLVPLYCVKVSNTIHTHFSLSSFSK